MSPVAAVVRVAKAVARDDPRYELLVLPSSVVRLARVPIRSKLPRVAYFYLLEALALAYIIANNRVKCWLLVRREEGGSVIDYVE